MTLNHRKQHESFGKPVFTTLESLADVDVVETQINYRTIAFSDVLVTRKTRPFWGRKWHVVDLQRFTTIMGMHMLCLYAPFCMTRGAICVAFSLYVITGMFGLTVSYHRNLTHRSFTLPKWLEYAFAYCGVLALQGSPIDWVSTHRYHHQFVDSENDPHSPTEGFWFSHFNWVFDRYYLREKRGKPNNVGDLRKQPFYIFIQKTYAFHPLALGPLLYGLGGFSWVVWGMGVRIVFLLHVTWLLNSASHVWGRQVWKTNDLSRNNWCLALPTFGEGWHNNHHAFEYSARHGLEWWQIDVTWGVIRLLEAVGLASNVKLPTDEHKKRLAFPSSKDG